MIIAGPGSGKTFTIIQRILYLIDHHHISPNEILVITFTKAAALEMKERYEAAVALNDSVNGHVNFGTFHSICYHILQRSGDFSPDSLIKEIDKRKIISIILANHGYAEKCNTEVIEAVLSEISRQKNMAKSIDCNSQQCEMYEERESETNLKNRLANPKQYDEKEENQHIHYNITIFSKEEIRLFQNEYQAQLEEQRKLDFDDMIGECLKLLMSHSDILTGYQRRFSYILVDEFQDINMPQYEVTRLLAGKRANLFAVGDDDQSIYGFRGSTPGIMQRFLEDYPNSSRIMLTENYRSGENIVKLAEKVISRNAARFRKQFIATRKNGEIIYRCVETRKEEENELTNKVKELSAEETEKSAVILRTNREVIQYRELLRTAGIPIQERTASENNIFRTFMIEDITAFLKFLYEGQKRTDFLKFMNKPEHYFTRLSLLNERVSKEEMKIYYQQNMAMQDEIDKFFQQLSVAESLSPYMAVAFFRKTMGYDKYVKQRVGNYQEFQRLTVKLDRIQNLLKDCRGKIHPEEFFREQEEKAGKESEKPKCTKGISVITMHGAKGLEFEHVFLPDVNEGIMPGKSCITKEALEEERRLLYVAITRAKNHLHIYCTKERNRKPSSFLQGIILPQ